MKRKLLGIIILLFAVFAVGGLMSDTVYAIPADSTPWQFEQPDGTSITLITFGDEFFSWTETTSGFVVEYDSDAEAFYYAYIEDSILRPGNQRVGQTVLSRSDSLIAHTSSRLTRSGIQGLLENIDRTLYIEQFSGPMMRSAVMGRPSIIQTNNRQPLLLLLVEFSDRQFSPVYLNEAFPTTTSYWSNKFFGETGRTVNTWFREMSGDFDLQFTKPSFTQENSFSVQEPIPGVHSVLIQDGVALVRLEREHPHPQRNPETGRLTSVHPDVSLAFEAVRPFVDFSEVPIRNNRIYNEDFNIYSVFAGYERTALEGVTRDQSVPGHAYPNACSIYGAQGIHKGVSLLPVANNSKRLSSVAIHGELQTSTHTMGIGVAVHEIGHLMGAPDFYDPTGASEGLGFYCVMALGGWGAAIHEPWAARAGWTPVGFGAFMKVSLGFAEPVVVSVDSMDEVYQEIYVHSRGTDEGYNVIKIVSEADPNQYFLVENRQQIGFDAGLFSARVFFDGASAPRHSGILIWHVDEGVLAASEFDHEGRMRQQWHSPVNNWMHRGVAVEGLTQRMEDGYVFFRADGQNEFGLYSEPNSNFHILGERQLRLSAYNCHPQDLPSNIEILVLDNSATSMQVQITSLVDKRNVVAEGSFADQSGIDGMRGARWILYEDGTLEVSGGFMNWTLFNGPWQAYRNQINQIIFTNPVTAGVSLANLFSNLQNVTAIEGLEYIDTGNVVNMNRMFNGMLGLTSLDVSSWDTSRVTNMSWMFHNVRSLIELDLSGWDTSSVTSMGVMFNSASSLVNLDVSTWDTSNVRSMEVMFAGANRIVHLDLSSWDTTSANNTSGMFQNMFGLRALSLGENFVFVGDVNLPGVQNSGRYTGMWQNIGAGTIENPTGNITLTSAELMNQFNGATMADTFVWQRRDVIVP
ncbi:MAG: BspA family leucine-rich repeat surface protein [Lachnospiraceae bacterium]|nr:BspA family leucine-rich repeat surface protein [Lachnospiraceae bacterium]